MRAVKDVNKGGIAIKPQGAGRIKSSNGAVTRHLGIVKGIKRQNASITEKVMPEEFATPSPARKVLKNSLLELNKQLEQTRAARLQAAEENGLKMVGRKRL